MSNPASSYARERLYDNKTSNNNEFSSRIEVLEKQVKEMQAQMGAEKKKLNDAINKPDSKNPISEIEL